MKLRPECCLHFEFKFSDAQCVQTSQHVVEPSEWVYHKTPIDGIAKFEMLLGRVDSKISGIRMYNKIGEVIFTTGALIEDDDARKNYANVIYSFDMFPGERII